MTQEVTREELELAMQSFEQMGGMAKYAQMIESAAVATRENFEIVDRALCTIQTLHEKQLQGIDHWIGLCKFLAPVFVTIGAAGLTISIPTFNSQIAIAIGAAGFLVFFAMLFELSKKRGDLLNIQEKELEKLNQSFQQGQELANTLKVQAQDLRGKATDEQLQAQLERALAIIQQKRTSSENF